jgi:hypothetical protein
MIYASVQLCPVNLMNIQPHLSSFWAVRRMKASGEMEGVPVRGLRPMPFVNACIASSHHSQQVASAC